MQGITSVLRYVAIVACVSAIAAGPALAAHPLISDDAGTLGKGASQIELNGQWSSDKETVEGAKIESRASQIVTTYGFGIAEKVDLTFGVVRQWGESDSAGVTENDPGSANFSLSAKWQFYENAGFCLALKPQLAYSYVVGGTKDDYTVSYGSTLIATKEFEPFAVHLNVGYQYNDYYAKDEWGNSRHDIWNASLAGTYDVIKERLKLVSDFGTATNQDKSTSELPVFALVGAIYSLNKNIDLSAGAKFGLTKPEPDFAATGGLTIKF